MRIQLHSTYQINTHFLTALWYYDVSALSDDDLNRVDSFIEGLPKGATFECPDENVSFERCAISNLDGDTVTVNVYAPVKEA